jgi:hypothetical protein
MTSALLLLAPSDFPSSVPLKASTNSAMSNFKYPLISPNSFSRPSASNNMASLVAKPSAADCIAGPKSPSFALVSSNIPANILIAGINPVSNVGKNILLNILLISHFPTNVLLYLYFSLY